MTSSPCDFDVGGDSSLWDFSERLESMLESRDMTSQLRQLCTARSSRSRRRDVILSRANRDEVLNFHMAGGLDKGGGVFVAKLEPDSKPYIAGLRRGDQVSIIQLKLAKQVSWRRYESRRSSKPKLHWEKIYTFYGMPVSVILPRFCEKLLLHTKFHQNQSISC